MTPNNTVRQEQLVQAPTLSFREFFEATRHQPVYVILGVQGSGTNLLGRMLTRLFSFSVMRDRSAVVKAAMRLGDAPRAKDIEREIRYFNSLVHPSAMLRMTSKEVIRKNQPFQGIETVLEPSLIRNGADFARLIYAYRAFSVGASHLAIKSDDLWQTIHAIDDVLPNRRIILLTRDFRDNLLSISGKGFGPIEPLCAAQYVKHQLGLYAAEYRRVGEHGYHVKFETLLNDTQRFVDDFVARFALPPADPAAVAALKFRPNKIGKWRGLAPQQLAWCEGILEAELREFGYPFASGRPELPGRPQLLAAATRDKIKRVPQKVRSVVVRARS